MAEYGLCGLDCGACDYKKQGQCQGCLAMKGTSYFGECQWYHCCKEHGYENCGECEKYPCIYLYEALEMVNGLGAIHNLKKKKE